MIFILLLIAAIPALASDRFPRPEFQSGYEIPPNDLGVARDIFLYYVDTAALFLALCAAAFFVFKRRSRKGVIGVMLFSIAYFGFFKKGCVCSLGAIQNITASLFSDYTVSVTIFLIFILPIIFALFFGRIFCAGVCPMGALQDFVAFKAKRIPARVAAALGFIPHIYLGVTILFAATGGGFLICKFDPFVGVFRLGAPFGMLVWGAGILLIGVFVARPYCRFLCPYGVLLGWAARVTKYKVKISPNKCVSCRLCEDACPTDAILAPTAEPVKEYRGKSIGRLKMYVVSIPIWIVAFAAAGWFLSDAVSSVHPDVKLLRVIERDMSGAAAVKSFESEALRADEQVLAVLRDKSGAAKRKIKFGMMILGAYMGIVIGGYLVRQSLYKRRGEYEVDPAACVNCGRCYERCPQQVSAKKISR